MKKIDKSKIINIILVLLSLVAVGICIYFIVNTKTPEGKVITILKDINSEEIQIIEDKNVSNKGEYKGEITIQGNKPGDFKNPEDIFGQKPIIPPKEEIKYGDPVGEKENPLKPFTKEDEKVLEVEEVIKPEPPKPSKRISLRDAKRELVRLRIPEGKTEIYSSVTLRGMDYRYKYLTQITGENGAIIIPFDYTDEKQVEKVKRWIPIYEQYKEEISFIFLNIDGSDLTSNVDIFEAFNKSKLDISEMNLPIYIDEYGELRSVLTLTKFSDIDYCVITRDSRLFKSANIGDKPLDVEQCIKDLNELSEKYIEQEKFIEEEYNKENINTYADVEKILKENGITIKYSYD